MLVLGRCLSRVALLGACEWLLLLLAGSGWLWLALAGSGWLLLLAAGGCWLADWLAAAAAYLLKVDGRPHRTVPHDVPKHPGRGLCHAERSEVSSCLRVLRVEHRFQHHLAAIHHIRGSVVR